MPATWSGAFSDIGGLPPSAVEHVDQPSRAPLAGQWPQYLFMQLLDYRSQRVPMPQPDKMRERLEGLSDHDLAAVSAYYGQVDAPASARTESAAAE